MQDLMTKFVSVDPTGTEHESYSGNKNTKFRLFGLPKNKTEWVGIASADCLQGIEAAKRAYEKKWLAGSQFAIAEAVAA